MSGPVGSLRLVDPGPEELALLGHLGLRAVLQSAPLPSTAPILARTRVRRVPLAAEDLGQLDEDELWRAHSAALAGNAEQAAVQDGGSLLDVKVELAERALRRCRLCASRCGVNRAAGQRGRCGLGPSAQPTPRALHLAEEALINPSLLVPVRGCSLRCRGCQQHDLWRRGHEGELDLGHDLPGVSEHHRPRTITFIGGNPDESLPAILTALAASSRPPLPIVWNHHAWVERDTIRLLGGVVDVFVPDLKFGCDRCAGELAGAGAYVGTVRARILDELASGQPVIVRHLVRHGHARCCTAPTLRWLADHTHPNLRVSLLPYTPLADEDRWTTDAELDQVRDLAVRSGLQLARPGLEIAPWNSGASPHGIQGSRRSET